MARNGLMIGLILLLIGSGVSLDSKIRKLVDGVPNNNSTGRLDSPLPSPVAGGKKSDLKPIDGKREEEKKQNDPPKPVSNPKGSNDSTPPPPLTETGKGHRPEIEEAKSNSSHVSPQSVPKMGNDQKPATEKKGKDNSTVASPPPVTKTDNGKKPEKKEEKKEEGEGTSKPSATETCDKTILACHDQSEMSACVQNFERGSKSFIIFVHNEGKVNIKVKLTTEEPESKSKEFDLSKGHSEKINMSLAISKSTKVILNAGNGECILSMSTPVSEGRVFLRLPSFDKLLTPVNGAYFLMLTVIVFSGTWACCLLRKKRRHARHGYQELEMTLPESVSAADVETAEGWDQVWDDDWDENAVKSPGRHHVGSISANGLTSRSSNKDGWENNWDD